MNFKIEKKVALFSLILIVFFSFGMVSDIMAAVNADSTGLNTTANTGYDKDIPFENQSLASIIGKFVGAGLSFIGVIFLILMIYGGFVWMTARGNTQAVDTAKDLIYSAVIGLIIVLAAYAITTFVGSLLS